MMNKIRKGKITKAEMEMTVKRIDALEKERRRYDEAVFDLINEFKDHPDLLKIRTKFEKDTSGIAKKEREKVKIVTMIAITAVVILIFRLLWALLRR